jgi:hypothetical protein
VGLLPADLKTELLKPANTRQIFRVAELDLPSGLGTVGLTREAPVNPPSPSLLYYPRVTQWGQRRRAVSDRGGSVAPCTMSFTFGDDDRWWSNLVGKGYRLGGSAARIYAWVNPPSGAPQRYLWFSGLLSSWSFPSPGLVTLSLRTNDAALKTTFPKMALGPIDFTFIDKPEVGKFPSLIYGRHDDAGSATQGQNQGAIPCLFVDTQTTNSYKFLASIGWTNVLRVYVGGVRQTTGFSISRTTINGRYYTLIVFTAKPSGAVTADIEGYESVGDGTGTLVVEATDVIAHFLSNFIFAEYQSGLWAPTNSTLIDTTWLADTKDKLKYLAASNAYGSCKFISTQQTGEAALTSWLTSQGLMAYWSPQGKIVIRPDLSLVKNGLGKSWFDTNWIDFKRDMLKTVPLDAPSQSLAGRITVAYSNIANGSQKYFTMEVNDALAATSATDSISLDWGPSTGP